jgi:hypothetical protein
VKYRSARVKKFLGLYRHPKNIFSTILFIGVPMTFLCLDKIANFIVLHPLKFN